MSTSQTLGKATQDAAGVPAPLPCFLSAGSQPSPKSFLAVFLAVSGRGLETLACQTTELPPLLWDLPEGQDLTWVPIRSGSWSPEGADVSLGLVVSCWCSQDSGFSAVATGRGPVIRDRPYGDEAKRQPHLCSLDSGGWEVS